MIEGGVVSKAALWPAQAVSATILGIHLGAHKTKPAGHFRTPTDIPWGMRPGHEGPAGGPAARLGFRDDGHDRG